MNNNIKEHICQLMRSHQWSEKDREDFIQAMFNVFDLDRAMGAFSDDLWNAAIDVVPADMRLTAAVRLLGSAAEMEDDGSRQKQIVIYTGLRYTAHGEVVPCDRAIVLDVKPEKREEESEPDSDDEPFPPSTIPSPPSSWGERNSDPYNDDLPPTIRGARSLPTNPPANPIIGLRQAVDAMQNDLCMGSISHGAE